MTISGASSRALLALTLACTVVLCWVGVAMAHPEPAKVPYRWELIYQPGEFRLYFDDQDGRYYWFMDYKVTNRTGRDQLWAPVMTLFTDEGEILQSGRDVPHRVTMELLEIMNNPLLEEQNQIIGKLLHGRENAREGLVIWPARELNTNELTVFVRGLSGESVRVINPVNGERVTLYKTLQRDYLIRGNARDRGAEPAELVEERWIMR